LKYLKKFKNLIIKLINLELFFKFQKPNEFDLKINYFPLDLLKIKYFIHHQYANHQHFFINL
jgi:hypothetical protein